MKMQQITKCRMIFYEFQTVRILFVDGTGVQARLQLFCKPLDKVMVCAGLQMCYNVSGLLIGAFLNASRRAQGGLGKTKSISSNITDVSMKN